MIDRDRHAIVLAENSRLIALLALDRVEAQFAQAQQNLITRVS